MDEQDLLAIMAYLRTLEPIENDVPDHRLDFPLNLIVNSIPLEAELRTVNREDPDRIRGIPVERWPAARGAIRRSTRPSRPFPN